MTIITRSEFMNDKYEGAWVNGYAETRGRRPSEATEEAWARHTTKAAEILTAARSWSFDADTNELVLVTAEGKTYKLSPYHNCEANRRGHVWCWHRAAVDLLMWVTPHLLRVQGH